MKLRDKVCIITGGAMGIGAAVAATFRKEGAYVFICDMNREAGEALAKDLASQPAEAGGAEFAFLDISKEANWQQVMDRVSSTKGRLDVLINNAGINIRKDIEEMPEADLDTMLSVNVKGPFMGIKHALPVMRKSGGGSILNMVSICGLVGHKFTNETYTMCKGALTLLTKSIASRYAKDNIRCNSVHPSTVDTPGLQKVLTDPVLREQRYGEIPLGRLATSEDVAQAFLYLASEEASFLNGVNLPVDGGLTAY